MNDAVKALTSETGAGVPGRVLAAALLVGIGCAPLPLAAQDVAPEGATAGEEERTVRVSARGTVEIEPDRATLQLAVESVADSAREAAASNAARMEDLVGVLREEGIPERHVRTTSYQLQPQYDNEARRRGEDVRIRGYRARNTVEVTIEEVDRLGALIDAAISSGANRVAGLSLGPSDPDAVRIDALREAVVTARARAEALAEASGARLGELIEIGTGADQPLPQGRVAVAEYAADAAETPIEPGTMAVGASVTAVWRLEEGADSE